MSVLPKSPPLRKLHVHKKHVLNDESKNTSMYNKTRHSIMNLGQRSNTQKAPLMAKW